MEKASKIAGRVPDVVITDALRAYIDGIELAFGSETKHIQSQPFTEADLSTNKIERWHSTLRTRIDIMRGLKSLKTAQTLLDGWLVHYNFFRTHESLNDRTPADYAGIKLPYKDWLDVIEGQRVTITPEPITDELGKEHPERYKYPAQRTPKISLKRKSRKIRRVPRKGMDTTMGEIRR